MAGSKREKRPGVWELRVYAGRVGGRSQYVSRTHRGDSKSAEVALARLVVEVADGQHRPPPPPDPDDPNLAEWLEDWYARRSPSWSPTSAATARSHIDHHIAPALGHHRLSELRLRDVEQWVAALRDKGLAPATVRRVFGVLHSALEQAERWELIARNPAAKAELPRVPYEETRLPSAADLAAALELAGDIHARTLIWLAAATGGRRGQLVGLQWRDFDLEDQVVTFHRNVVKVAGGIHIKDLKAGRPVTVALDEVTVETVAAYRRARQETALAAGLGRLRDGSFVFARDPAGRAPWHPDTATKIWDRIRNARDAAGELAVPGLQGVRLHDLRHAHATVLIAEGISVKAVAGRLGHATTAITLDRYAHRVTEEDRRSAEIIGRLLSGA